MIITKEELTCRIQMLQNQKFGAMATVHGCEGGIQVLEALLKILEQNNVPVSSGDKDAV